MGKLLSLLLAAYVIHGLYIYQEARNAPPPSPATRTVRINAQASAADAPTAPWAENYERLRRGEYAALVDSAWATPEMDSMAMAAMAISRCATFMDADSLKKILAKIDASSPRISDLRLKSLEVLRKPCRPLEGRADLLPVSEHVSRLFEAGRGGPYDRMLEDWSRDLQAPKDVRAARMRAMMATNDPLTMGQVIGHLTRPDATLDGEQIPWIHRGAYMLAWAQVSCVNYEDCHGPDTRQYHLDCMYHGDCDYIGPETFYRILFPVFIFGDRTDEYYLRIQAHLDRRRYDAFGLP